MLVEILKSIGAKVAASAIGAFLAPFKLYFLAAAMAAVIGSVGYYIYTAETAKAQVIVLEDRIGGLLNTLDRNKTAIQQCLDTNAENESEAIRQAELAQSAVARVAELEARVNQDIEDISHEAETFRTEFDCPALTDDFRQWVRD